MSIHFHLRDSLLCLRNPKAMESRTILVDVKEYIFCMGLGFSAPQANGRPIFAIQRKALWEQCATPPAVFDATHVESSAIAKSGISPKLDRDMMSNELWWLKHCFGKGIDIGAIDNPFFEGEAVNICHHSRCEMTEVGDPFCSDIRVCLCFGKLFGELWWLNYCFYVCIGIGAVGNPILGGEVVNSCCHSRCVIIEVGNSSALAFAIACALRTSALCHRLQDFPLAFASIQSLPVRTDQTYGVEIHHY